jgi:curved DNA-binding protein CbpA
MNNNRRNFYRILHVQPEAPLEIIKASYRSLMTKLKAHPDLGGDHETAVLINHAYSVLGDPARRRQYDQMLQARQSHERGRPAHESPSNSSVYSRSKASSSQRSGGHDHRPPSGSLHKRCLFCGTESNPLPKISKHCVQCASPLTPAQAIQNGRFRELFGRRAAPRIAKAGVVTIYPNWPHAGFTARLRDFSPSGISLLTAYGARAGQIIKFDAINLKGVAHIVSVRTNGSHYSVHASFLTAEFIGGKSGVFVAEKV